MIQAHSLELWIRHERSATFLEIAARLDSLRSSIQDEAVFRYFLAVPVNLSNYVDHDRPFGETVWTSFPSSRADLCEAGKCIAYGLYSASVYHSMCALEPAMKVLARHVSAPWNPKASTWHGALVEIEKKIKTIASGPKTRGQVSRIAFLSQAASEFRYFKDGWRNDTMHARCKAANNVDAERVLAHVGAFLALLSTRMRERRATRPSS